MKEETVRKITEQLGHAIAPADVSDGYEIHPDGGLIYNPVSREKKKCGEIRSYNGGKMLCGTVSAGSARLTYSVPAEVTAYDAVPVVYSLDAGSETAPVHVEAVAFEAAEKTAEQPYYDLALPGKVDLTYEFLGYIPGTRCLGNRPDHSADLQHDRLGKQYPHHMTGELCQSSVIPEADYLWFRFRYKNTGDTVLDGDGTGTFCFEPLLYRKGEHEPVRRAENLFYRIIDEVYPGESGELTVAFGTDIPAGEYVLALNGLLRNETVDPENYGKNIWGGETVCRSEMEFTVAKEAKTVPPVPMKHWVKEQANRNRWLHTYEEFMTSFDSWLKPSDGTDGTHTLYIQPAPWTNQIKLKLILGDSGVMSAVSLPVSVESDSLKVQFNPENKSYVILPDGTRFPAIQGQSMADMRANVQLGPDADAQVIGLLLDMRDCGINCINTTAAFEYDHTHGKGFNDNIDAFWFSADVMRRLGMKMEGFMTYPYEGDHNITRANWEFGLQLPMGGLGSEALSLGNGYKSVYQLNRWGDNYWLGAGGEVILSVEDTRGWMRVDFNARMKMTEESITNFRGFLKQRYGTIAELNRAWNTEYASFDAIDPEEGTQDDHGYRAYRFDGCKLREWSQAVADLDIFRTLERIHDYTIAMGVVRKTAPTAMLNFRTEGGNFLASVPEDTKNAHYRHTLYSQRRNCMIPELLIASGLLYAHSDYVTLPYTPSEVRALTAKTVAGGIVPIMLPQFDRMRDIAVNPVYGTDFSSEYNIGKTRGAYINTVCSVFEWFRATYEAGGVPGILWQDYLCDGYATATQRKEIRFFTDKLLAAMNTPEAEAWKKNFDPHTGVLKDIPGRYSYAPAYVDSLIEKVQSARKQRKAR